jgi:hypothetical protein
MTVVMTSLASTGHFRRTHGQSPSVLTVGAAESAPMTVVMTSLASTGHFRRTHGQSPRVLTVGAAESAP